MTENKRMILKTLKLVSIIILYYIVGNKNVFPYILSLSLYNIFSACFDHIKIKDSFKKINSLKSKNKLFKLVLIVISIVSFIFMLLSILISDLLSVLLNINNITILFTCMGLCIITKPLINLLSEYFENKRIKIIYDVLDNILLLIIAIFIFRIFNIKSNNILSLLYLSKIISMVFIIVVLYLIKKPQKLDIEDNINYKKEVRKILKNNHQISIIKIVKNTYYYISIILIYLILSTRYNYNTLELGNIITFIYFYSLTIIDYLVYLAKIIAKDSNNIITEKIYRTFKMILTITIIFGIISPLTCKIIFNNPSYSIYLTMVNFLAIFILLYDITYENIKNNTITYLSLTLGIITKIIITIPLINSFYRMGYNLVYGDILSTIIAMFISIIINYIYLKRVNKSKINYFEKILDILYDNILLCIILLLVQFIVPIDTSSYLKSFGLIIIYLIISIVFIKIKNKKRG